MKSRLIIAAKVTATNVGRKKTLTETALKMDDKRYVEVHRIIKRETAKKMFQM